MDAKKYLAPTVEQQRICVEIEGPGEDGRVLVRHFGPEGVREFAMAGEKRLTRMMDELRGDDIFEPSTVPL